MIGASDYQVQGTSKIDARVFVSRDGGKSKNEHGKHHKQKDSPGENDSSKEKKTPQAKYEDDDHAVDHLA
jgi:hypothetical protein